MKKIASICLSVLSLAAVSCNVNELPGFDDSDAFVAFLKSSYSIAENGGTLSIPIHASSLSAPAAAISVKVNDGSAKQGVDFTLNNATGVVNIPAGSYEGTLDIKIIPNLGVFTGDKSFTIDLVSAEGFTMGAESSVKVTIQDTDHPLSALFGTYSGALYDAWGSEYTQSISLSKDDSDVTMVWISNFDPYWSGYCTNMVYGIVSEDMTTITIPNKQELDYYPSYYTMYYFGADTTDEDWPECDIVLSFDKENGTLTFETGWGTYCSEDKTGNGYEGYWSAYYSGTVLKKQ